MSYLVLRVSRKRIKNGIVAISILILVFSSINILIQRNETLIRRFTLADIAYQEKTSGMRIIYINRGFEELLSNPLGKGIEDTQVIYRGRTSSIHNQYLTFLVGGGLITLIGLIIFFSVFVRLLKRISHYQEYSTELSYKYIFGFIMSSLTFFVTLFGIEMSGLLLFMMISFLFYSEMEVTSLWRNRLDFS